MPPAAVKICPPLTATDTPNAPYNSFMKRTVFILAVLLAGIAAGVLIQRFFPLGRLLNPVKPGPTVSLIDLRISSFLSTPAAPPGGTVFVGDSHVEMGRFHERWPTPAVCRGVSGATVAQVRSLVPEVARHRPATVVIQCGTNDILAGTAPTDEYTAIVRSLLDSTDARVVVCEVPTLAAYIPESERRNRQIAAFNTYIRALAGPRVLVCHLAPTDADRDDDGIHLSPSGYAAWERALIAATPTR